MRVSENPSVLVADDDPAVARSVGRLVGRRFTSHTVTALSDLAGAVARYRPNVVLFDLMWASHPALPELSQLAMVDPRLRICMHSNYSALSLVTETFRAGACGYLLKPATADELHAAITAVVAGEVYLGSGIGPSQELLRAIHSGERLIAPVPIITYGTETHRCASAWLAFDLCCTNAESVILLEIAMGGSKKQIARRIGRAESTVAEHLADVYRRFRQSHGISNIASVGRWVAESLARRPAEWGAC